VRETTGPHAIIHGLHYGRMDTILQKNKRYINTLDITLLHRHQMIHDMLQSLDHQSRCTGMHVSYARTHTRKSSQECQPCQEAAWIYNYTVIYIFYLLSPPQNGLKSHLSTALTNPKPSSLRDIVLVILELNAHQADS